MGIDDVSKTVSFVMGLALALTSLALALSWRRTAVPAARVLAAFVLGAVCWTYNVILLLSGARASSFVLAGLGIAVGIFTAVRLSGSDFQALRGVRQPTARVASVLTAWSALAIVVFTLVGIDRS